MASQRRPMTTATSLGQPTTSPRPKTLDKDNTFCRNITIYGRCRYIGAGCPFRHEIDKPSPAKSATSAQQSDMSRKTLNVESPSFTPASLSTAAAPKKPTFSSAALSAAVFTPRNAATSTPSILSETADGPGSTFNPAAAKEFTPSMGYNGADGMSSMTADNGMGSYDAFAMGAVNQALSQTDQYNAYGADHTNMGGGSAVASAAYYQGQAAYAAPMQPLQYHLYAPTAPYRQDPLPYQRSVHDFFMPDKLREELDKKSHAVLQVMPNIQLPSLDTYHSLVPLDTLQKKSTTLFGYITWVYKATSSKNGKTYCLRRLEGYRLTDANAIRTAKEWRQVQNSGIVNVVDAFTTRAFGDSSLIFAQEFFPLSQTLTETHFPAMQGNNRYRATPRVAEPIIWSYIVQISKALKAIHSANLAARCLDPSKILVTNKNRIRLNACSVLDVVQFGTQQPLQDLQQEDFVQFGKLILYLTSGKMAKQHTDFDAEVAALAGTYSNELKDIVSWLLMPSPPQESGRTPKNVNDLVHGISHHILADLEQMSQSNDTLTSEMGRELENGRLARLVLKLGTINERYEYDSDPKWSENAERYLVKLFRDFVFHSVDDRGRPVVDIGHMIRALNKLDAGSTESLRLTSRDGDTDFIVTYKEMKKQIASAFADLTKHNRQA